MISHVEKTYGYKLLQLVDVMMQRASHVKVGPLAWDWLEHETRYRVADSGVTLSLSPRTFSCLVIDLVSSLDFSNCDTEQKPIIFYIS